MQDLSQTHKPETRLWRKWQALPFGQVKAVRATLIAKGIHPNSISRDLRKGGNRLGAQRLQDYADAFGCTTAELLDDPTPRKPRPNTRGTAAALASLSTPNA